MTQNKTIEICITDLPSERLINKIAIAKFPNSAPVYAEQLSYMAFCDKFESDCFHVAATDNDDNVYGYLYCIQNNRDAGLWYYGDLFVIPDARRQGIATQMIRAAMRHLSELGASALRCYVEGSNEASLKLQASLGSVQKPWEKFNDIDNEGQIMHEFEIPTCFSVRGASSADAKYIMPFYVENIGALHGARISYRDFADALSSKDEDELNFLVYKGALPIAWLKLNGLLDKSTARISMLVVHNKFRHQGVGRFALQYAERYLKENNFSLVKLHTTDDNISAKSLYHKMGYSIEASEKVVYCDGESGVRLTYAKGLI